MASFKSFVYSFLILYNLLISFQACLVNSEVCCRIQAPAPITTRAPQTTPVPSIPCNQPNYFCVPPQACNNGVILGQNRLQSVSRILISPGQTISISTANQISAKTRIGRPRSSKLLWKFSFLARSNMKPIEDHNLTKVKQVIGQLIVGSLIHL